MATNNNAHTLDTAGNPQVDFVWGNMPLQPNDVRTENVLSNFGGSTGDTAWSSTTYATPARLDFAGTSAYSGSNVISNKLVMSANHELEETGYSGYPAFTAGVAKYMITQVDGDGTTVTYQCQNFYNGGETVDITGCGSFNLTSATVAKATRDYFTVTNSTTGSLININYGIVQLSTGATASDGAYIAGVAYIDVPSVLGQTTALAVDALKDAGYAAANITTASAATNTPVAITAVSRTSGSATATISVSGGTTAFPVGTKIVVAGLNDGDASLTVNGTWTVMGGNGSTVTVTTNDTTAVNISAPLTGTPTVAGVTGTVKTQSTAAGTGSVALSATITVTPWA